MDNLSEKVPQKSVKKNYFYNLFYQIFTIIVPLVVTPYVSRVLKAEGIGQNSFVLSIVSYFTLFAALGFGYYAQREIARCLNDKEKQSKVFWEILIIRLFSTSLALIVYFSLYFSNVFKEYSTLFLIYSINVASIAIDVNFIFQGNEDFKQISIRNFIVKALTIAAIFIFVKTQDDLWIYALINALGTVFSALIMFPFLKNYLTKISPKELKPFRHLVPTLRLFVPTIAVSLYTVLDKTMIGLLLPQTMTIVEDGVEVTKKVGDVENGYYEQAYKIILMGLMVVTSLGTVLIPRNSGYFESGQIEKAKENISKAFRFVLFIGVPMMFGLAAIAQNFSPWFFGDGYEKVPYLIMIFSWLFVAIGLNNVFGIQYLIPSGKDNIYTISVICGAVSNLIMNSFMIPLWKAYGAAIASIISETIILLVQVLFSRKEFNWKKMVSATWKYWLAGAIMFGAVYGISYFLETKIWNTLILIVVGAVIYFLVLLLFRDCVLLEILQKFRVVLSRRKKKDE
jgi:O-antigen/teichoic acid export membrane protein